MKYLLIIFMLLNIAFAEEVELTRIEKNVYETADKKFIILTAYCYKHLYHQKVYVSLERNILLFKNNTECPIRGIYEKKIITD